MSPVRYKLRLRVGIEKRDYSTQSSDLIHGILLSLAWTFQVNKLSQRVLRYDRHTLAKHIGLLYFDVKKVLIFCVI